MQINIIMTTTANATATKAPITTPIGKPDPDAPEATINIITHNKRSQITINTYVVDFQKRLKEDWMKKT